MDAKSIEFGRGLLSAPGSKDRSVRSGGRTRPGLHSKFGDNAADSPQYKSLRAEGEKYHSEQRKLVEESQRAYRSGDKARAKDLSDQAKAFDRKADAANLKAARLVFAQNNESVESNEIDLHGLFVSEALSALAARLEQSARAREQELHVITGKGIHSQNHVAKLRPAVEEFLTRKSIPWNIHQSNVGVVIAFPNQGFASGYAPTPQGYAQGYSQGYNQGYSQNYSQNQSHSQGYNQQNYNQQNMPSAAQVQGFLSIARRLLRICC